MSLNHDWIFVTIWLFLTDMLFDEDTTLLSFFENFSDPEDEDELKENIIKYVGGGNFGGA